MMPDRIHCERRGAGPRLSQKSIRSLDRATIGVVMPFFTLTPIHNTRGFPVAPASRRYAPIPFPRGERPITGKMPALQFPYPFRGGRGIG